MSHVARTDPMPRNIPLLILDEIVLPTAETEVSLSDAEHRALDSALGGQGAIAAIVARPPGSSPPTSLERKAAPSSPGPIMRACVFGNARLLAPDGAEPGARLHIGDILRGRLVDVTPNADSDAIWRATVEPWGLEGDLPEGVGITDLRRRFLRLLLGTRDLDANATSLGRQLGRPLRELSATGADTSQLWLLADYLFEREDVRVSLLQADELEFVAHTVADALELAETGLQLSSRALARPFAATVAAASADTVDRLSDLSHIIDAFAPLVMADRDQKLSQEAERIADSAAALASDVDRLVTRLVKASTRKRR